MDCICSRKGTGRGRPKQEVTARVPGAVLLEQQGPHDIYWQTFMVLSVACRYNLFWLILHYFWNYSTTGPAPMHVAGELQLYRPCPHACQRRTAALQTSPPCLLEENCRKNSGEPVNGLFCNQTKLHCFLWLFFRSSTSAPPAGLR